MEAIKQIGELIFKNIDSEDKYLDIFTEDFSKSNKYNKILEIELSLKDNSMIFNQINLREYDLDLKFKYLYRSGSSNGTDITPTSKITEVQKTFFKKIIPAINEGINFYNEILNNDNKTLLKEEKKLLSLASQILEEKKEFIYKEIENIFLSIPKKERFCILTLVIEINGEKKYIGDFEIFKERMRAIPIKKFYYSKTENKEVVGENKKCCLCNSLSEKVYGLASPLAFYTIDKPGYISGNFDYEKSWRNFPICKQCAIELELGKIYLDENLQFSFYDRKFYLIPKLLYKNQLEQILKKYKNAFRTDEVKKIKSIESPEEKILKILSKENNYVTFDLMFIEKNNAALNILVNIEDVYPSTFKKLYEQWAEIKDMKFFEGIKEINYLANFNYLNILFKYYKKIKKDNKKRENDKDFSYIIDKLTGNGKIDYNFLIKFINEQLVYSFNNEEKNKSKDKKEKVKIEIDSYRIATFRAYTFIYYLYKLNKFKNRGKEGVKDIMREEWHIKDFSNKQNAFNDFFELNKAFFNTESKKAVFLVGYLTKKLLNIQFKNENGRKPFLSNLNDLKINKRDLLRLIPKIQGKLQEYKKEYYNEELQIISEYIIISNNLENLSNLDIPLYFSMGMNMEKKFKLSIHKEEDDNLEEEIKND
ncbi:TIGR02556 family CRISPR-associated protein [Clostridium tarantellae]|uniref:TIGR02556 family CRISPR-associated protein n=1 Tax=Clostridium tarantellae TaxID=39493 RepID=A0A6I1MMG4_9CLOT|nr:TIGR02556 family CRISPR-associated protein [Clostridium tarantellae]MPQ43648.1 TIGR02556 family CRISPR-associated protein [Clostridium tarantellae]